MASEMIKKLIDKFAIVWPLQQFVATNPMGDLTCHPIKQAIALLDEQVCLNLNKTLHNFYINYDVSQLPLHSAVKTYLANQSSNDMQVALTQFITSEDLRYHIVNHLTIHHTYNTDLLISKKLSRPDYNTVFDSVKTQVLNWLSLYFGRLEATELAVVGEQGFFDYWAEKITFTNAKLFDLANEYKSKTDTLYELFNALGIPESVQENYSFQILWQLKGWVGYVKWTQQYKSNPWVVCRTTIEDILIVWLCYELYQVNKLKQSVNLSFDVVGTDQEEQSLNNLFQEYLAAKHMITTSNVNLTNVDLLFILLQSLEEQQQMQLITQLNIAPCKKTPVAAQLVFCIDVRSEGFRRYIEQSGPYQTFGFAGFFGFVYQLQETDERVTCQCPALLEPDLLVKVLNNQQSFFQKTASLFSQILDKLKASLLSAFALYEIFGLGFLPKLFYKNYVVRKAHKLSPEFSLDQFDLVQCAAGAKGFLTAMGLNQNFADIIVVAGHHAVSDNNPYQAGLDCGACGGNAGDSNAIIACHLLNNQTVRSELRKQGITIPDTTTFIAASHNTTTDEMLWYDGNFASNDTLARLKADINKASKQLREERNQRLPGSRSVFKRQQDWAEIIPELGLVNNMALIIGPRDLTRQHNFEQRIFLHSYDPNIDQDGAVLESIFLGPMVVAHWINIQYFFSTLFPDTYGSGNKVIHNVLPNVGVMEGNMSDLKVGLPIQSVSFKQRWLHQPVRLLVVVYAQQAHVNAIVAKHQHLTHLVNGEWLKIRVLEPQ